MQNKSFHTRTNIMQLTSLQAFAGIRGGSIKGCKDVYFYRAIGTGKDYLAKIQEMDQMLGRQRQEGGGRYVRRDRLPHLVDPEYAEAYARIVQAYRQNGYTRVHLRKTDLPDTVKEVVSSALKTVLELFVSNSKRMSSSIELNFLIKMLYWTEELLGDSLKDWTGKKTDKFVFSGIEKIQEYLFCYYVTLLGYDVMILAPAGELLLEEGLLKLSGVMELGMASNVQIPAYIPTKEDKRGELPVQKVHSVKHVEETQKEKQRNKVNIKHPNRESASARIQPNPPVDSYGIRTAVDVKEIKELEFEELALFAKSVVMIAVHERDGKVTATGSGIMIGRNGYILTNNHVIREGAFFTIRIEEEEETYVTDEVIKYHSDYDLALLKIERTLEPIRLYQGKKKLVRGQKVVAIGSPLGLFNSVSDGIISGFRTVDGIDMIQFTAPISHGSSGGAVLNMQGELIGISTAGIDMGQNLNLAVDYQEIAGFVRGFAG